MSDLDQQLVAGGNFAYDSGRVIRFIFTAFPTAETPRSELACPKPLATGLPIAPKSYWSHKSSSPTGGMAALPPATIPMNKNLAQNC